MKKIASGLVLLVMFPLSLRAQIGWTEHVVASNYGFASWVFAIDLDGDDNMDILGTSYDDNEITWWENDGSQSFTEHTIASDFYGAYCVHAIDIDDDDDIDVIGAAYDSNMVAWWENDGSENFTYHVLSSDFSSAISVHAID
ncbi:VCBS repeat-containing protein, partial [candidate division WOR-3 bacterium]|nr:VCBS repeat-containing protein [candidate division WOR-3 bacterium]